MTYSVLKINELSNHDKTWRKFKCKLLSEKTQSGKVYTYASQSMTFWKSQNYGDGKKISCCQGLGGGGMNRWSIENFQGSETTLYDTIMVDTCHYNFVQTHRMYNTKSEL